MINSQFKNCLLAGVDFEAGRDIRLMNNTFENIVGNRDYTGRAVYAAGARSFTATGNIISNCQNGLYLAWPISNSSIHGNHFLRAEDSDHLFVQASPYWDTYEFHWDLSNNYWGTTDPEEISRWINDAYDADNAGTQYVDFLPVADGPVATEKKSLGGLRSMFR